MARRFLADHEGSLRRGLQGRKLIGLNWMKMLRCSENLAAWHWICQGRLSESGAFGPALGACRWGMTSKVGSC